MVVQKLIHQRWDQQMKRRVDLIRASTGNAISTNLCDPWAPRWWNTIVAGLHDEVWDEIEYGLKDSIMCALTYGNAASQKFEQYRLTGWPEKPPRIFPRSITDILQPVRWFRARLLYALLPADSTLWRGLRSPVGLSIFILNLINPYGFSVWLFVLLFILMDKSDEFQLVFFIQKFKSFQAIGALIGAATASNKLFRCSLQPSIDVSPSWQAVYARLNEDEPLIPIVNGTDAVANSLLENATAMVSTIAQVAVNTAFKSENAEPCSMISPGSDPKFKFNCYAEPVRILLVWMAFFLLAIGHAKGGVGEVEALEMVRTDLADGTLDGEAALDDVSTGSGAEVLEVAPSIVTREIKKARKKCGARTGKGGVLPYFLIYDILVALYCIWNYVGLILCNGYSPTDPDTEWKFWTTIFMMQQTYAV